MTKAASTQRNLDSVVYTCGVACIQLLPRLTSGRYRTKKGISDAEEDFS